MSEENKAPKEEAQPEVNANAQPDANPGAELNVNDLNAIKQIIDVASQRGAFKPNEMTVVGTTYNKLEAFLNAVQAQQQSQEQGGQ